VSDDSGEATNPSGPAGAGAVDVALLLRLEHVVAEILAGAGPVAATFGELLSAIGDALGWPVGSVWTVSSSTKSLEAPVLRRVATWEAPDFPRASFASATQGTVLERGVGLPGRVWASGQPAWITDVRQDPNFPRSIAAAESGLAAAFCFPIVSRDGVEGLMEFFVDRQLEPAPELLGTMASLGSRIGDTLRRQRLDEAVRRSEARIRAVLAAALDAVIIADDQGEVLEFNPAACAIFGYRREDAVGHELAELIVPPDLRPKHRAGLASYSRTQVPTLLDRRIEITGMRADGAIFPVELTITRIAVSGPPVYAGYVRDLSDRRRAEQELQASRHRAVEAAVAERARLERDLHDGAQQSLISLGAALARARTVLPREPDRAAAIIDDAIAMLEEAAVDLRNLARGIYPSSLTRHGLAAAMADIARRSPVDLALGVVPSQRFPASVEATAYFIVSEALTNVARHAGDVHARVDIRIADLDAAREVLEVSVVDDGPGGASPGLGSGLRGIADRVALLDGSFEVVSPPGGGTALHVRIPLP